VLDSTLVLYKQSLGSPPSYTNARQRSRDGPFRPFRTVCAAHQHYLTNSHHMSIDMCVAFVRLYGGQLGPTFPTKPAGTRLWVQVRVTPGSTHVDPCKNPYPPSGCGFLVGTGLGTSKSTWGLPMHFTNCVTVADLMSGLLRSLCQPAIGLTK